MTLEKALGYYKAIEELSQIEMDCASAYAVVRLKKKLKDHVDFFIAEEMKLVQTYGKRNAGGIVEINEGTFRFDDDQKALEYRRKRKELGAVQLDTNVNPVKITAPAKLRPALIEDLEGLVEFDEGVT